MRQLVMALVLGSSCVAAASHAHEAGDFLVRVGVAQVAPDASSGSVLGGGVDVEDATGLGFSGTWFATPHIGIAMTMIAILSGQVGKSVLIDHFGWFGATRKKVNGERWLALLLIVAALVLIARG